MIYRQVFHTFVASKSLKLSFTLNCVLNDFKMTRCAFKVLQKFDPPVFPFDLNRREKNLVGNLQYGPRTRLVSSIYCIDIVKWRNTKYNSTIQTETVLIFIFFDLLFN